MLPHDIHALVPQDFSSYITPIRVIFPVNSTANCDYSFINEYDPSREDNAHALDLIDLAYRYQHIKYDRKGFAAAIACYADPRATVLNFATSCMVRAHFHTPSICKADAMRMPSVCRANAEQMPSVC